MYVDDEPVGTTSQQGRLKLTQLTPGRHSVRISMSGFQDYEETITLAGGQVTTVAATLQRPEAPPVVTPQPSPEPPNPEPEAPPPVQGAAEPNLPPSLLPHRGLVTFAVAHDH